METSPACLKAPGRLLFSGVAIVLLILSSVSAQTFEWAALGGGSDQDRARRLASDGSTFVYAVGSFRDRAHFGAETITSAGDADIFLARYRTDGKLEWVKGMGGPGPDEGFSVATDGAGTVCITGAFAQTAVFGSSSLTSYGGRDIFLACFSNQGELKWVRQAGGTTAPSLEAFADDYGADVAFGPTGSVYVSGEFFASANFDGLTVTSNGKSDGFLARYDRDGSIGWVRRVGGPGTDDGYSVAVDPNGNAILSGYFGGTATFGAETLESAGSWDIYISKWGPDGSLVWAKRAGGASADRGVGGVSIASEGDVYFTGYFRGPADFGPFLLESNGDRSGFICRMNSDGTWVWAVPISATNRAVGGEIDYSPTGHIYVSGTFAGEATFGNLQVSTPGDTDVFVSRLNSSGTFEWVLSAGSILDDWGSGLALSGPRVLVSGDVGADPLFDPLSPSGFGEIDAFVASIDLRPQPPSLMAPTQDAADVSTSASLSWASVDLANRYDVQVANDAAFAGIVYTENTPATQATFVAPVAEHGYYWRVHGIGLVGPGEWSESRHFTVGDTGPLAPQLVAPADKASGVSISPLLTWTVAPEADWYRIQFAPSEAFVSPEINVDHAVGTSYQSLNLAHEQQYYWRVAGVNEAGKSTFSAPRSFVTIEAAPGEVVLESPTPGSDGVSPQTAFFWQETSGADRYHIQVAIDEAFSTLVVDDSTLTEANHTVSTPLQYATTYYWRVRAHNLAGFGPWCPASSFVVAVGTAVERMYIVTTGLDLSGPGPVRIALMLSEPVAVRLAIFDTGGRLVTLLTDRVMQPGRTVVEWDAAGVANGVYFARLVAGGETFVRSIVVVR